MKKEIKNALEKKITLTTTEELTVHDLVGLVSDKLDIEDIPLFIALLDNHANDWSITAEIIAHYQAVHEVYKADEDLSEEPIVPKLIVEMGTY